MNRSSDFSPLPQEPGGPLLTRGGEHPERLAGFFKILAGTQVSRQRVRKDSESVPCGEEFYACPEHCDGDHVRN